MSGQAAGSDDWNKVYIGPRAPHSICMLEGGGKWKVNTHTALAVPLQRACQDTRGLPALIKVAIVLQVFNSCLA